MLLGIGRDRHLEIADPPDAGNEVGGILVSARMRRVGRADAAGRIAAQRHDMRDADVAIIAHHRIDFLARGVDAGQMRRRHKRGLVEHALDGRVRALAGRAAGAVGHRHEMRRQRRKPLDRVPKRTLHLFGLRRKELERDAAASCRVRSPAGWRVAIECRSCNLLTSGDPDTLVLCEPERNGDLAVRCPSPARCSCAW